MLFPFLTQAPLDFGEEEGQPYMVLPLLPGGDVEDLIEKAPDHRLPLDRAIGIAKAVSNGLVFAHSKGIVHRDLKPGIGKTALCEQLYTHVTLRGGRTLVGHCYEEGSLSLPYRAFVEALRSYVQSRETSDLQKELGTGAPDVARIVSEIRERPKIKIRPQKDPEEERYRLLQAVTGFLGNAKGDHSDSSPGPCGNSAWEFWTPTFGQS